MNEVSGKFYIDGVKTTFIFEEAEANIYFSLLTNKVKR